MAVRSEVGGASPQVARALALAAEIALAVALPLAMTIANKSAPLVMCLAALLAFAAVVAAGRLSRLGENLRALALRLEVRLAAMFAVLALGSLLWTVDRARSLRSVVELLPVIVGGVLLVASLPIVADARRLARLLAAGILAAGVSAAISYASDMAIHRFVGGRAFPSDLKRGVTPLAVLVFPALALLALRGAPLVLRAAMIVAAFAAGFFAHSGSAMLAVLSGSLVLGLVLRAPRAAAGLAGALVVLLLVLAPAVGPVTRAALPDRVEDVIDRFHARHRMDIWSAFGERALERPVLGHGFGAPDRVSGAPRPAGTPPDPADDEMIRNIHPHNAPLQVWVELGLAGVLLAGAFVLTILRRMGGLPPRRAAPRLACFAAALAASLVGFGLWQAWWIATLSVAVALFAVARRAEEQAQSSGSSA